MYACTGSIALKISEHRFITAATGGLRDDVLVESNLRKISPTIGTYDLVLSNPSFESGLKKCLLFNINILLCHLV